MPQINPDFICGIAIAILNPRDRRAVSDLIVPTDGPTAFSKALPRKARQRANFNEVTKEKGFQ